MSMTALEDQVAQVDKRLVSEMESISEMDISLSEGIAQFANKPKKVQLLDIINIQRGARNLGRCMQI
eukprot:3449745-Prorocentrum_lima.AAC.1